MEIARSYDKKETSIAWKMNENAWKKFKQTTCEFLFKEFQNKSIKNIYPLELVFKNCNITIKSVKFKEEIAIESSSISIIDKMIKEAFTVEDEDKKYIQTNLSMLFKDEISKAKKILEKYKDHKNIYVQREAKHYLREVEEYLNKSIIKVIY